MSRSSETRIIDADVDFYKSEMEHCAWHRARCNPGEESYWGVRYRAAEKVVKALNKLRDSIDEEVAVRK